MKKFEEGQHENSERWLLTYSDLITLLMIFFVIMYAMSNVDAKKYSQLAQSLSTVLTGGRSIVGSSAGDSIGVIGSSDANIGLENLQNSHPQSEIDKLNDAKKEIDDYLVKNGLDSDVVTRIEERGLLIRLKNSILFDSGKADIKSDSYDSIVKIGSILKKMDSFIRVEGHTDNIPISNSNFKSNWYLSSARAINVAELLIKESGIAPEKIAAVGYGEYKPVADNSSNENRAKNRRVDIIIVNSKFNAVENNVDVGK